MAGGIDETQCITVLLDVKFPSFVSEESPMTFVTMCHGI